MEVDVRRISIAGGKKLYAYVVLNPWNPSRETKESTARSVAATSRQSIDRSSPESEAQKLNVSLNTLAVTRRNIVAQSTNLLLPFVVLAPRPPRHSFANFFYSLPRAEGREGELIS